MKNSFRIIHNSFKKLRFAIIYHRKENRFTFQPYDLTARTDKGNVRETFFFNQLNARHTVYMPPAGDFLIDKKYLFEVGGKSKTFQQIKDLPDSFLAVDDTEIGHKNRIPLWMFGMLY